MSLPYALFGPGHGARAAGRSGMGPVCPAAAARCELMSGPGLPGASHVPT
jgi:hypothetical protein